MTHEGLRTHREGEHTVVMAGTADGPTIDVVRASGYSVVPNCPFVRAFITRNEEYGDLLYQRPPEEPATS